jgi:Kef-type K+ transport system membrane component KefB
MPPAVGLLLAGVALGPSGLHTLPNAAPVAEFFGEIGKLLLMFFAGLEVDLSQFRRTGIRSLVFGSLTFSIPLVVGAGVGRLAGYGWLASLLIGSLMASHTLLGFPIVQRMKLVTDEAVAVTIGGTVFTDLASGAGGLSADLHFGVFHRCVCRPDRRADSLRPVGLLRLERRCAVADQTNGQFQ